MAVTPIQPIFGSSQLSKLVSNDVDAAQAIFQTLQDGGITTLDVTREFPGAEEFLSKTNAGTRFIINSKTPGGIVPGTSTRTGIMAHAKEFVSYVGAQNVDVYIIHAPDPTLDLADMCKGMDEAHKAGYFKRFGLSNFSAEEVEEVYETCKAKGYILPTVYEGSYNAVGRKPEEALLPTLRRLGICFYAYSPIAGGFLTKTVKQMTELGEGSGRFGDKGFGGKMYNAMYNKPSYHIALEKWAEAAEAAGCSTAELAYRWVAYDSALKSEFGDALEFGCSKVEQISQVLAWLKKGPVGAEAKAKIDEIWRIVKDDAPMDNYQSYFKDNPMLIENLSSA